VVDQEDGVGLFQFFFFQINRIFWAAKKIHLEAALGLMNFVLAT
jgi:hypothetical protein